jgi:hypothetical protein
MLASYQNDRSEMKICQIFGSLGLIFRTTITAGVWASPCNSAHRPQIKCTMQTQSRHPLPARLHSLAAMAGLLERLEQQPSSASAAQYRDVARQITALLAQLEVDEHLHALLNAAPATAELYENMRYAVAGLCRAPLDDALRGELTATAAIAQARKTTHLPG